MNQFSSRLLRFVFFCTVCFAIFSLSEDVHAEVSRRYLRDPDGCGYTWTSGNDQYTCDLACYDRYTNYGYQKHTYEIYHNSSALGADRENGLTDGKKCSVCNAVTAAQTVIAAREHSFWGEWTIGGNDKHRDFCRHGCGFSVSMSCDFLSVIIDDAELTICPICGRFGDQELAQKKKASISDPAAKIPGTSVIRALLNPVADNPQCLAAITAVYERNGRIAPLADNAQPVTVKLPQMTDAPCQLLFASVDEQTQAPRLLPVKYTVENGQLIFTVNQLGLFLLIAE